MTPKIKIDSIFYSPSTLLGEKLRVVANELLRASDLLEGKTEDTIIIFNEYVGKIEKDTDNE